MTTTQERTAIVTSILLLVMLAHAGQAVAQESDLASVPVPSMDYQLGPGDVLSIHVSGLRQFDQTTRVSNSGRIHVPYVGVMLVGGLTALQVESEIAKLIKQHELINEPSVRVQIDQHRAQPTYVVGELATPGQYVISGEMYLLDLISKAGGVLPAADEIGYLYRRNSRRPVIHAAVIADPNADPGNPTSPPAPADVSAAGSDDSKPEEVLQINLTDLTEGTAPEMNLRLQGGDILYVPRRQAENIFIIGDVRVPGGYTLPRHGQITAAQAVIYAGGPMPTAKMKNGFLMRHDEAGVRQAIPVDFSAIIEGKRPDLPVQAGDIIFIPNSPIKTITQGLITMLPRLAQQLIIF